MLCVSSNCLLEKNDALFSLFNEKHQATEYRTLLNS